MLSNKSESSTDVAVLVVSLIICTITSRFACLAVSCRMAKISLPSPKQIKSFSHNSGHVSASCVGMQNCPHRISSTSYFHFRVAFYSLGIVCSQLLEPMAARVYHDQVNVCNPCMRFPKSFHQVVSLVQQFLDVPT